MRLHVCVYTLALLLHRFPSKYPTSPSTTICLDEQVIYVQLQPFGVGFHGYSFLQK